MRTIKIGEMTAQLLQAYFDVWLLSGEPALTEAGGQPQISINGQAFDATGIGPLVAVGFGRYTAAIDRTNITTVGDVLQTRYRSGITSESVGDSFLIVASDSTLPNDAVSISYYGTMAAADAFFNNSLSGKTWKKSSPDRKRLALLDATRIIDRLNFGGNKISDAQVLQFPRGNTYTNIDEVIFATSDVNIPNDIKTATYLIADKLLDGFDPDIEADIVAQGSTKYAGVTTTYNREFIPEHLVAGIPSARAWALLRPYIRDTREITLARI